MKLPPNTSSDDMINAVLMDPAISYWLKDAVQALIQRDPVDALSEAYTLATLMLQRCNEILGISGSLMLEPNHEPHQEEV